MVIFLQKNNNYLSLIKKEIKVAFVENKYLLLISALLFIIPMFAGYFFAPFFKSMLNPMVDSFRDRVSKGEIQLTQNSLFFNNVYVAIVIYFGGIIFGLLAAALLISNGLFIGFFATQYDLYTFILLTLPHGIFEIPGIIIAGAGGFTMFIFIFNFFKEIIFPKSADFKNLENFENAISSFEKGVDSFAEDIDSSDKNNTDRLYNSFNNNVDKLIQSIVLLVVAVILIVIASFVEAYLTIPIAIFLLNFL